MSNLDKYKELNLDLVIPIKDITNKKVNIRPSSLSDYFTCQHKWFGVHVMGIKGTSHAGAMAGTAIHSAAEKLLSKAIETGKIENTSTADLTQHAIDVFNADLETKSTLGENIVFGDKDCEDTMRAKVEMGVRLYVNNILPSLPMPLAVELPLEVKLHNHPMIDSLRGTADFITKDIIGDIKTSSRAISSARQYELQQWTYTYLANKQLDKQGKNKFNINKAQIFGLSFGSGGKANIIDIPYQHHRITSLLRHLDSKLRTLHESKVSVNNLFVGNPTSGNYLCDERYCPLYNNCKFRGN